MRRYCSRTITIPYWATNLDEKLSDIALSSIWSPEFFGNVFNFVEEGPFANWTDSSGRRLTRNMNVAGSLISDDDIERLVEGNNHYHDIFQHPENRNLDNTLETIHVGPHAFVGGTFNLLNRAAYDPIFFFYHAFVDYLFEKARESFRRRGFNPATDYPSCRGVHDSQAPMANFTFFRNIDGLNDIWTNQYFYYADIPTCSARNRDCGSRHLTCVNRRGQWGCQPTRTNYIFDVSPEVRMASAALDQQLPGQRFLDTRNTSSTGLVGVPDPIAPNIHHNPWNPGQPNVEPPASVPGPSVGSPNTDPQIGTGVASPLGTGSNTIIQLPQTDPVPGPTGLAQTPSNPSVPSPVQNGAGLSHFGNHMVHSIPVQPKSPQGNLYTGVHSAFNPFEQKPTHSTSNVGGMELPVIGNVGGMELPVLGAANNVNPFEPKGLSPPKSGPEIIHNLKSQTVTQQPPVVVNPAPANHGSVGIGPQPNPYTPPPKPSTIAPQPPKPQAPSIISNMNLPGNNQGSAAGNFFSWRQQQQNSFSIKRQKRSVQNKWPSPLETECNSWIHQMAYPIQNSFEIDGVADSSKWLYVPVSVKVVRSPNRTYEIYGYRKGVNSMYDIYDPQQSRQFQRRVSTHAMPQRKHSSISGSGASQIYLKSDGLSYEASYVDYVVVDERLPISEYTGFVAIKNPDFGRSDTHISVFDSLGEICKPRCATSRSRSNPKYRPCSGVIRADTSSPDMAFKSIPEAMLSMYTIKDPYPPRMYRPPYLEFLCENTNTFYWEGCENDRYQ